MPRFVEEAADAGVEHTYDGSWEFFVGGGVAVFDCDDDERPDLFFAGGSTPASLFRNQSPKGGALRFERISSEATDLTAVMGAYPLDIDSDGITDLAVLRNGENVLLRGLGGCAFERANEVWSFDGGDDQTAAFSAIWEEGEAWPTLAFGNYIDHVDEQYVTYCALNYLVRPSAGGGFAEPIALEPGDCALSLLFSDWSRSGRRDLRVANDRHYFYADGENQLWQVLPDEPPRLYTREEGWQQVQIWGMGIASQDLTQDGYPEAYLTSIGFNRLETLAGDPLRPPSRTSPTRSGSRRRRRGWDGPSTRRPPGTPSSTTSTTTAGWICTSLRATSTPFRTTPRTTPTSCSSASRTGRSAEPPRTPGSANCCEHEAHLSWILNGDGLLDLVEVNRYENVGIRRNVGRGTSGKPRAMGHWLAVKLEQPGPNSDAIGAWIEVELGKQKTLREVTVGGGHAGGELGPVHFGLGDRAKARLRVTWPDGSQGPWQDVDVDGVVTISRQDETASPARSEGS